MTTTKIVQATIAAAVLTLCGCGQEKSAVPDRHRITALQWDFTADSSESDAVLRRIDELLSRREHPDSSIGVVSRFGPKGRYLLLVFRSVSTQSDSLREVMLYAFGDSVPGEWSVPFTIGTAELGGFGITEVADFDGDALPDAAYCDPTLSSTKSLVVGYAQGRWYPIKPKRPITSCDDSGVNTR